MAEDNKRKMEGNDNHADKRAKTGGKKQWQMPNKYANAQAERARTIYPGDKGIWATCTKGKEKQCGHELLDLFTEYAREIYGDALDRPHPNAATTEESPTEEAQPGSIEEEINREIKEIKKPSSRKLFETVLPDVLCVVFFRCFGPIDPVVLAKRVVEDAAANPSRKRTRFTHRLSPMTILERASEEGLAKACDNVLKPHFHDEGVLPRKFAIRTSIRNHGVLKRDIIIKLVAEKVGNDKGHSVDLKDYDLLILVEVYKNVCGLSVVDHNFDALKRYNLSEIFEPSVKEDSRIEQKPATDVAMS